MTDIFFSYKSDDRERVRPVRDAFAAQGFDVFWDQEVPSGEDWDSWIRRHLAQAKCAIVFWSSSSETSANVRHEATVAREQGKLIPVLLEPLASEQFPMGHCTRQAVNLTSWKGDFGDESWAKLRREVESMLTPRWLRRTIHELEAELVAERARRESAEERASIFQAQITKEAQAQFGLRREKEMAQQEAAALGGRLVEAERTSSELETRVSDLQRRVREAMAREAAQEEFAEGRSKGQIVEHELRSASRSLVRLRTPSRGWNLGQWPGTTPPHRAGFKHRHVRRWRSRMPTRPQQQLRGPHQPA